MVEKLFCSSCQKRISNTIGSTKFSCPNCDKQEIIRCTSCREKAVKYNCPACEFEGPN